MKMAEQTSFLSIASVTGAHSGNYTCIAKNRAGEDRYTAVLHVNGIPLVDPRMSVMLSTNAAIFLFSRSPHQTVRPRRGRFRRRVRAPRLSRVQGR